MPGLIKVFSRNESYFEFAHVTFHCIIIKSSFHVDNPKKYSSANMKLNNKKQQANNASKNIV